MVSRDFRMTRKEESLSQEEINAVNKLLTQVWDYPSEQKIETHKLKIYLEHYQSLLYNLRLNDGGRIKLDEVQPSVLDAIGELVVFVKERTKNGSTIDDVFKAVGTDLKPA